MSFPAVLRAAAAVLALSAPALLAQQTPGPAVGAKVPGFSLSDQTGVNRTLSDLMGPKGLMLVFFRSADW